jgi:hypothetical protein
MTGYELIELIRVLRLSKPKNAIEIGSFCGITSKILGWQLSRLSSDSILYCIDIFDQTTPHNYYGERYLKSSMTVNYERCFDENIESYSDLIKKVKCSSDKAVFSNNFKSEFIFIDGDHSYAGVKRDIIKYMPYLSVGGYVCFHDVTVGRCGTLRALLDTIWPCPNSDFYKLVSHVDSLLVLQKISDTPECGFLPEYVKADNV